MAQSPPPPPSGGAPAGSNKNLYTILSWALFPPIGSFVMLFVGKDDADVKNNAASATVIHGGALAVYIVLWVISVIVWPLAILATLWGFVWFVIWVIGVVLAVQAGGRRVMYPVLGPMTASYVPALENMAK